MRRILLSIPLLLLTLLFALPALAGNWGEDWGTMVWGIAVPAVPVTGWPGLLVVVVMLGLAGAYWLRRPSAGLMVPVLLVLLSIPLAVAAGTLAVPNDFVDGDPAYASEVNANFDAVEASVNDNDSRIGAAQAAADAAQIRVGGSCPAGSSIRAIAADGTVTCEVDTDTDTNTTYSAAAGVILTGTTFTADPSVLQGRINSECPAGSSIRKISVLGGVVCEIDTDTQLSEAAVDAFAADNGYGLATDVATNAAEIAALVAGSACLPGFTSVVNGRICVSAVQAQSGAFNAIGTCKGMGPGSRVCTHNDLQQACGSGMNPYSGIAQGWYGDHGIATGGNMGDEFMTWNRGHCDDNNDGYSLHAFDLLPFVCCY